MKEYCVVIYGDWLFGSEAVFVFSSPEAADSFILFLQEKLLQEHIRDLKGIALFFDLQVKYNLTNIYFELEQVLAEMDAPK